MQRAAGRRWARRSPTRTSGWWCSSHTGPVFCSGADLKETAAAYASGRVPVEMLGDVLAAVWEFPKPVRGAGRRPGPGGRPRADRGRRPGGVHAGRHVRVHRGAARGDPGGDQRDGAAAAGPACRRRAVPDRRRPSTDAGPRRSAWSPRRWRPTSWTRRWPRTATPWPWWPARPGRHEAVAAPPVRRLGTRRPRRVVVPFRRVLPVRRGPRRGGRVPGEASGELGPEGFSAGTSGPRLSDGRSILTRTSGRPVGW